MNNILAVIIVVAVLLNFLGMLILAVVGALGAFRVSKVGVAVDLLRGRLDMILAAVSRGVGQPRAPGGDGGD